MKNLQKDLAKKAGISPSYFSELVSGEKRLTHWPTIKRIAENLKTTTDLWTDGTPKEIREALNLKVK